MQLLLIYLLWKAKAALWSLEQHRLYADSDAATSHRQERPAASKVTEECSLAADTPLSLREKKVLGEGVLFSFKS